MGYKALCLGLSCILLAYHVYRPIPEGIEEPWKVQILDASVKMLSLLALLVENVGIMKFEELYVTLSSMTSIRPSSDENTTVIDTDLGDIPVRLYLPTRTSGDRRPAVIYLHGGAFVMGSSRLSVYDFLNRDTASVVGAVVVSVDYRLAPQHQFPVPLEDCLSAVKFFLQDRVLREFGVDPARVCVAGDSSGGLLAAQVVQALKSDPEFADKIKAQALIYPGLQLLDTLTPSYVEYQHGPILPRDVLIKLVCLYVTKDQALPRAMLKNQHLPRSSHHLLKFINWSVFLPEKYKKNHVYTEPVTGMLNASYFSLVLPTLPLLANDSVLQSLPLTYVLTCQHDLLRDDGLIFVTRLRNAGARVAHEHLEDGVHGALAFTLFPFRLQIGHRIKDKYIHWLKENL
ncbi:arylacetamide deacetylase-like 2 [Perognathus longimembris pacificus]|uniref:arylacetamide deacetylase-like 2 n=1 Tax=Perognathus longimembris pacificus TaxID=214514 RepID=UPI00201A2055|nr:arylacetamide deacetylase-like 2 [Perognathus longimembris pacificus]